MNTELKEAIKLITEKCKQPNHHEQMKAKSLSNRIYSLKGDFLHYVDTVTINYMKTQHNKKDADHWDFDQYTPTELSKSEKQKAIEYMEWFVKDIQSCISHLKNY